MMVLLDEGTISVKSTRKGSHRQGGLRGRCEREGRKNSLKHGGNKFLKRRKSTFSPGGRDKKKRERKNTCRKGGGRKSKRVTKKPNF